MNPFGISTQPERVLPPKTELEDALFGADQRESQTLLLSMRRESSFTEDICVYEKNTFEKFLFRARLDTGMNGNFVKRSQAMLLGYPIEEYTGIPCIGINGSDYYPEGQVTLPFHFKSFHSARTWRVEFLVVTDDAPFDMALGIEFISHADLLRRTREALPVTFRKVDSSEFSPFRPTKKHALIRFFKGKYSM